MGFEVVFVGWVSPQGVTQHNTFGTRVRMLGYAMKPLTQPTKAVLKNLYINSGHFRYGVTMAPASAEILLNEITGAPQPFDVAPYQAGWIHKSPLTLVG